MKPNNIKLIIVPDVHGRTFWEDVFKFDAEIVFLGDYLDPYPYEEIYPWDALDNFTHILSFAKGNPRVHLLIGNHDLAYVKDPKMCQNRIDRANYDEIHKLFIGNEGLFSLAYECTINGKHFFLSHAGITPGWHKAHSNIFKRSFSESLNADYINRLYLDGSLNGILGEVGYKRYGSNKHGSIVWADIYEHEEAHQDCQTDTIQIVGHTQRVESPLRIERPNFVYDVDIRQCVYLDTEGNICLLDTGENIG